MRERVPACCREGECVHGQRERTGRARCIRRAADDGAAIDDVDAVLIRRDVHTEELGRCAAVVVERAAAVAAEDERGAEGVRETGRRVRPDVGQRGDVPQRAERERWLHVRVDGAPWPPCRRRQAGDHLTVERTLGTDAELDRAREERVRAVERVQVTRIRDIRGRHEGRLGPVQPDLVGRRALDRRPADKSWMRAVEVLRDARPAGVEAVGRAPGGGALVRDRADVCVEGVRRAGDPGQGEIDGHRRRAQVLVELRQLGGRRLRGRRRRRGRRGRRRRRNEFVVRVRPDDRALRERLARRQLEFVPDGAADGQPRKRGRAVELVLHGLVGAQQERSSGPVA